MVDIIRPIGDESIEIKYKDNGDGSFTPYVEVELTVADEVTIDTGAAITGETLEPGGSGLLGWLASIRKAIATTLLARLPTALGAGGGLKVDGSGTALPISGAVTATTTPTASETHAGEVSGPENVAIVTPPITAGVYHANDVIGGIMEIPLAARSAGKPVTLISLVINDKTLQAPALQLWFFTANPAAGTYTDNAALTVHATDLALCCGVISTGDGAWYAAAANGVFTFPWVGLKCKPSGTSLFCIARVTGTPTFASVSDLTFRFAFDQA